MPSIVARFWPHAKALILKTSDNNVDTYAALMAYYFFFSLFPLILFVAALVSLVANRQEVLNWVLSQFAQVLPANALALVRSTVQHAVYVPGAPGILSLGILFALWSGSSVFGALIEGLNQVYEVRETRPWWRRQLLRLVCVVVSSVIVLVATVILLNGEGVVSYIGRLVGLGPAVVTVWSISQIPLAIGFVLVLLWFLYWALPNVRQRRRRVWIGAATATALWLVATALFRLYVQRFHAFNPAYGVVGAFMVLLTWMYFTMFVVLLGGEVNALFQRQSPSALEPARPPRANTG